MPNDRDGGGDDGNVIYLTPRIEVTKSTPKNRPAERSKPAPTDDRRSPPVVAVVAAVAAVAAMAVYMGGDLLILAAIAGVLVLGAALARKRRRPQRGLGRPRTRTREAPGDRRMELHVWCEFEIDHEPTMIEAVEAVLADLYEEEERRSWSGR